MLPILAAFIVFLVLGLGDMVATKTKAIVSSLFFGSVVFLLGFWTGLFPTTLFADSTLLLVGGIFVAMLLVHLGTIIKLHDFIQQWKTVIIAGTACVGISIGIYFVGQLVIDRVYALIGAPILSGGVVATLIMQGVANNAGMPDMAVFATLVMITQGFVGYPVASFCLKSEAKRLRALAEKGELDMNVTEATAAKAASTKKLLPQIPAKYNGPNIIIAKVAIMALLATLFARVLNSGYQAVHGRDWISHLVVCLVFGLLGKEIGFLDEDAFGKANATGMVMPVITVSIFTGLSAATPQMVLNMLWPLIVVVVIGTICFVAISIPVGRIFKYSWQMSVAIGSTCLYGFPGTYIVSHEVVDAYATSEAEKKMMLDRILPTMLISGMVTVSITSVLIAGVMAGWL